MASDHIKAAEGQLELAVRELKDKGPHYLEAFENALKIPDSGESKRVTHNIMVSLERDFNVVFPDYMGFANFGRAAQKPMGEVEKCDMALKLLDMYGKELLRYAEYAKSGSVVEHSQVCTQAGAYFERKGELLERKAQLREEEGRKKMARDIYADAAAAYNAAATWWGGSYEAGRLRKEQCEKKAADIVATKVPPAGEKVR